MIRRSLGSLGVSFRYRSKVLPRRANHRHSVSLAAIDRSNRARAGKPAAGFLRLLLNRIFESGGGRIRDAASPMSAPCRKTRPQARRRPNLRVCDQERIRDDRVSDIARFGRAAGDRAVGGHAMSADIIPFAPRRDRKRFVIALASASSPGDLVMDHVDTSPDEISRHCEERRDEAIHPSSYAAPWIASLRSQ